MTADVSRRYVLEGGRIASLEDFYTEVSRVVVPGVNWGRNLDAFNDILRGGFGTPEEGFLVVWKDHAWSRERLGYAETTRQLERRLQTCHSNNRRSVQADLAKARSFSGPTVFDWIVAIITDHGPSGTKAQSHVLLELT